MVIDTSNKDFENVWNLVRYTDRCIYLTGKAGSGKTTLLRYIASNTDKNTVILAPTGVAAINAGGQTIHSFFKLPFGPLLPNDNRFSVTKQSNEGLFATLKYRKDKVETIQKLELLIIDEVSMVRADVLDLIDKILKAYRNNFLPFGGVQVMLIGDPFQLPPVFKHEETQELSKYYDQLYFFGSDVFRESKPMYIELKKVYRQEDQNFIDLLNRIRVVDIKKDDLAVLNEKVYSKEELREAKNVIILTTTNQRVDRYNSQRLDALDEELFVYDASIKGNFPEKNVPTEIELKLKVGAQVMFVKNDPTTARTFYNGMLATVTALEKGAITVINNSGVSIEVKEETWENISYKWNKKEEQMNEEILGTFKQFPVRLAWAITVHKSQGLSFDRIIADVSSSFSPGQIYVALSRCTSLGGLMLTNPLVPNSFHFNATVQAFALQETPDEEILAALDEREVSLSITDAFTALEDGNVSEFWSVMDAVDENGEQWKTDSFRIWMSAYLEKMWQQKSKADNLEFELKELKDKSEAFEVAKENLKVALKEKRKLEEEIKKMNWEE